VRIFFLLVFTILSVGCGDSPSSPSNSSSSSTVSGTVTIDEYLIDVAYSRSNQSMSSAKIGVPGALISFISEFNSFSTISDDNGSFLIDIPYGSYAMMVEKKNDEGVKFFYKDTLEVSSAKISIDEVYLNKHSYFDYLKLYFKGSVPYYCCSPNTNCKVC